jgi:BTB/POZ domain-containing protein 1/2
MAFEWKDCAVFGAVPEDKISEELFTKTRVFDRISYLYNNSIMSDIKLTCGDSGPGEVFFAHKYILAATSPVFYSYDFNISSIHLSDVSNVTLAGFLSFLYRDECPTDVEEAFKVLRLAMEYQISSFTDACKDYLQPKVTPERAFKWLETLIESKAEALADVCWTHIDSHPNEFFSSEHFLKIKKTTLDALLGWY